MTDETHSSAWVLRQILRDAAARVRAWRPRRLRLTGVIGSDRLLAVLAAVAFTVVAVLVLLGWFGQDRRVTQFPDGFPFKYRPFVLLTGVVAGGIGMVCLGLVSVRSSGLRRAGLSAVVVGGTLIAFREWPADMGWFGVGLSLLGLVLTTAGLIRWPTAADRSPSETTDPWVRIIVLAAPFAIALVALSSEHARAAHNPLAYAILSVFQLYAAVVAGAVVGIALAAGVAAWLLGWQNRLSPLVSRAVPVVLLTALLLAKAAYLAARYLGAFGDFFGDDEYWHFGRDTGTWVHALAVGAVVVGLAIQTWRRPIPNWRQREGLLLIVAVLVISQLVALAVGVGQTLVDLVRHDSQTAVLVGGNWALDHLYSISAALLTVAAAFAVAWTRHDRQITAGAILILITIVWVEPLLGYLVAGEYHRQIGAWEALPQQVDVAITVAVGIVLAGRRWWRVPTPVLVRLLFIPMILLSVPTLLPASLADRNWRALIVAGLLVPVLLTASPVASDPRRQRGTVLLTLGAQLALLVGYYIAIGGSTIGDAQARLAIETQFATLWLSVPIATLLCCRLSRDSQAQRERRLPTLASASPPSGRSVLT